MTSRAITRGIAVGAATAFAAGALALSGTGVAGAATGTTTWADYYTTFTRTVSNTTPDAGDIITMTTKFQRTNGTEEYLYNIKDRHDSCLAYVPGSAKMNDVSVIPQVVDDGSVPGRDALVSIDFGPNEWVVKNQPAFNPVFSVSYKVGADCVRGRVLVTGMDYNGSLGFGGYYTQGPGITVSYLNNEGPGGIGTGSLGSLFGS